MKIIKSFIACISTYSRIPMPKVELDSEDMKYALLFFPFIGLVIGCVEYVAYTLSLVLSFPDFVRAVFMASIPVIISGGIHVDGFMDTIDALSSYGDREKKLSIMKDPNAGAFSIIYLFVFGLIYVALIYLVREKSIFPFCLSFAVSRILSGISVSTISSAKNNGMLHDIKKNSDNKIIFYSLAVLFFVAEIFIVLNSNILVAALVLMVSAAGYFLYRKKCIKEFGGVTGDTSGFFLCVMELVLLIVILVGVYL